MVDINLLCILERGSRDSPDTYQDAHDHYFNNRTESCEEEEVHGSHTQ